MPSTRSVIKPSASPEPAWEAYIAELGRLDNLLQLTLNDQARCDPLDAEEADGRAHSVIEIVQDRLGQLADRIERDCSHLGGLSVNRAASS